MTPLTHNAKGYAARAQTSPLAPLSFDRRNPGPYDVQMEILYCGVCHSDLHMVRNEWGNTPYPCVPGHEMTGRVVEVGNAVTKFKEGDRAAVGVMVDSCRTCPNCPEGLELRVPESLNLAAVAPLLCAGITTYSPLRYWNVRRGQKIGVVGLGGLGHMAVKFANALGAHVVLFTTSLNKKDDALRLGAHDVVISKDEAAMQKELNSFDFILDTVSANHDLTVYLNTLKRDGTLTLVGLPEKPLPVPAFSMAPKRRKLAGSLIGGLRETQEMLEFCAEHGIVADIEMIQIQQINEAFERMLKSDVKYRFVIDMTSLK
jgi:uncharacterized zinc-type alcohol dehydrogenase-like protein